jgi:hypothetical protein
MREKITHFDHERIPERIVHARGAGAHGYFEVYDDSMKKFTKAGFLTEPNRKTPVFVRFSTVAGFRGSTDLARDVRGFAVKFYTDEGNYDLVGNNIPVFFIQGTGSGVSRRSAESAYTGAPGENTDHACSPRARRPTPARSVRRERSLIRRACWETARWSCSCVEVRRARRSFRLACVERDALEARPELLPPRICAPRKDSSGGVAQTRPHGGGRRGPRRGVADLSRRRIRVASRGARLHRRAAPPADLLIRCRCPPKRAVGLPGEASR